MVNIVVGGIIVLILVSVVVYIVRAKRRGVRCIGCPSGGSCASTPKKDDQSKNEGCGCDCGCSSGQ